MYSRNSFVINVVIAIVLAYLAPSVGLALAPDITASRIAVGIIFFLSGLGLKTRELVHAVKNFKFNFCVQAFSMGVVTVSAYGVAQFLRAVDGVSRPLADGVVICGALPMTVNMVIVLTKSAGGDEAAAIFNSALGNLLGVFITPAWVSVLVGNAQGGGFGEVLRKLAERVLAPLFVGQICQYFLPSVAAWAKKHKKNLKRLQESCLVFIVYCVFCERFRDARRGGDKVKVVDIVVVVVVQVSLLVALMFVAWHAFSPCPPKLRVMALYGSTHKTVAAGIPLIDAIYSEDPNRSLYILPLLVWHPAQLLIGSALTAKLFAWVKERTPPEKDKEEGSSPSENNEEERSERRIEES